MYRSASALARLGLRSVRRFVSSATIAAGTSSGKVEGIETDGSVTLRDPDGSARSLRAERVEIRRPGPHGRLRWQVVSDVAITWEQLELFEAAPEPVEQPGRHIRIRRNQPTLFDD